jgi:hypothetical protein
VIWMDKPRVKIVLLRLAAALALTIALALVMGAASQSTAGHPPYSRPADSGTYYAPLGS